MEKKNKRLLGISLIVSAITMLFTLLVAPGKDKKGSRFLSVLALIEGLVGLSFAIEEPRRLLRRKKKEPLLDDEELFAEDEADNAVEVIHAELSRTHEGEGDAPRLNIEVPCDEEACEEDFI